MITRTSLLPAVSIQMPGVVEVYENVYSSLAVNSLSQCTRWRAH